MAAMDQLLDDPARRRELGWRGYQAYQRLCTADAHLPRYLALIRDVAGEEDRLLVEPSSR